MKQDKHEKGYTDYVRDAIWRELKMSGVNFSSLGVSEGVTTTGSVRGVVIVYLAFDDNMLELPFARLDVETKGIEAFADTVASVIKKMQDRL